MKWFGVLDKHLDGIDTESAVVTFSFVYLFHIFVCHVGGINQIKNVLWFNINGNTGSVIKDLFAACFIHSTLACCRIIVFELCCWFLMTYGCVAHATALSNCTVVFYKAAWPSVSIMTLLATACANHYD